jgi:hypothetical protein
MILNIKGFQTKKNEPEVRFLQIKTDKHRLTRIRLVTHKLSRTFDGDASLDANSLAKLAADAFFLIHDGDLEEFRVVGAGLHRNTIEGANIHAKLAGRAGNRVYFGFRNSQGLDLLDRITLGINDGLNRAIDAADTTIDAKRGIDVENGFLFTCDGFGRALHGAKRATDAIIQDDMWQGGSSNNNFNPLI